MERLLDYLELKFDIIIIFVNENYILTSMYHKNIKQLERYKQIKIMGFGYKLRSEIIKKWKTIGIEEEVELNYGEFDAECREAESTINLLMGENLFPRIPQSVLMLLQQLECTNQPKQYSKYAQLYEFMIWQQLDMSLSQDDIDMYKIIMSILAYKVYKRNPNSKGIIKEEDIVNTLEYYNTEFRMNESCESLKRDMLNANILIQDDSRFQFKYEYMYFYFLGLYMSNNLDESDIRQQISFMCKKVYKENYYNILLFLCHLSGKDKFILEQLLIESSQIFSENIPYDLNNNYSFVDKLCEKIQATPEFIDIGKAITATNNRKELLIEQDRFEKMRQEKKKELEDELENENDEDLLDVNRVFKSLQLLGQLLKNYPGSLKEAYKFDIVKECYELGLRLVDNFMKMLDENIDLLVEVFSECIWEKSNISNIEDVKNKTREMFLALSKMISTSSILNIAKSVNTKKLKDTYSDVIKDNPTLSNKFIDLAIKFETSCKIPYYEIVEINKELKESDNDFAKSILIKLVSTYLYTYPYDRLEIQKICSELNISQNQVLISQYKRKK